MVLLLIAVISAYATMQAGAIATAMAGGVSVGATALTTMMRQSYNQTKAIAAPAASTAGKMTFGAANIATRGGAGRMVSNASSRLANVSNRYMKNNNSMSN